MADGHHHGHGHGGCEAEHISIDEQNAREQFSLFEYVDTTKVFCLNEMVDGSAVRVFKPYARRTDKTEYVESDADEQLIIHIPFTGDVKLTSFCMSGISPDSSPSLIKAWKNRSDLNFDNVETDKPLQEWALQPDMGAELDYPTSVAKWHGCQSITFFIENNFGSETTCIAYIGLKGSFAKISKAPVNVVYEAKPQPKDHEVKEESSAGQFGF
mmetsp:Transcript_17830/g.50214  ORF Transcript_17830/g.50214 Transcript_17830/m.50214 type:complete len:213 (+) Transcript_17830:48-686(+)